MLSRTLPRPFAAESPQSLQVLPDCRAGEARATSRLGAANRFFQRGHRHFPVLFRAFVKRGNDTSLLTLPDGPFEKRNCVIEDVLIGVHTRGLLDSVQDLAASLIDLNLDSHI